MHGVSSPTKLECLAIAICKKKHFYFSAPEKKRSEK